MTHECATCGSTATDIAPVDPEWWFQRSDDGAMHCQGCLAIQEANRRWEKGDW